MPIYVSLFTLKDVCPSVVVRFVSMYLFDA